MSTLAGKEVLLGVSGGIACYKAVEVLRGLKRAGAEVTVVMTDHAREFVQPLTFQTLSNRPVGTRLFDLDQESRIGHIAIAERAQLALVAPCTANLAAKLRAGLADDLLSTVLLATRAPLYLALAMNDGMLEHAATQDNLGVLAQRGVRIIPPEVGFLAEGKHAVGRLADPAAIVAALEAHFASDPVASGPVASGTVASGSGASSSAASGTSSAPAGNLAAAGNGAGALHLERLAGRRVLVTAGPTAEDLDPVRFLTNRSSGRMGFALAEAARDAGARVTLVTGPVALADPAGVTVKHVRSAEQMRACVLEQLSAQDALILAAAVSDYRAKTVAPQKIKREGKSTLTLELEANPDIAAEVGERRRPGQVLVVFAAESQDLLANAAKKLDKKRADLIAANDISEAGSGFAGPNNRLTLLRRSAPGAPVALPLMDKRDAARHLLAEVAALLAG